ncbi:MAG: hypothetical protein AAF004_04370 [Pseudomonadota bacterium]
MNAIVKTTALLATMMIFLGAAAPADAARMTTLEKACEQAIQSELEEGKARIKRVSVMSSGDETTFWMTVRHKGATQAKSTRYRAMCKVDKAGQNATIELEQGWWEKTGRSAPTAVKF